MFQINFCYKYLDKDYCIHQSDENFDLKLNISEVYNASNEDDPDCDKTLVGSRVQLIVIPKDAANKAIITKCELEKEVLINKDNLIYLNGYQTWTDSKEFFPTDKMRGLHLIPKIIINKYRINKYGDYHFIKYPYKKGVLHGFTYAYIREGVKNNNCTFIGSINDDYIYTIIRYYVNNKENENSKQIIESDISGHTLTKTEKALDFINIDGTIDDVFSVYKRFFRTPKVKKMIGYSSWYNHYENITEAKILKCLEGNIDKNWELIQIDDGYTIVGDWFDYLEEKFPNGLKKVVDAIHAKGLKAGVWMAPFSASSQSKLFKEHKELFIDLGNGKYFEAGSNWHNFYLLDLRKKGALDYVYASISHMVNDLGFDFLKLDFLYSASLLNPVDKFRAQILSEALDCIRSAAKDAYILGCGVPLAPAFGRVDYCRISCDVSLEYDDKWYMRFIHRERVSSKSAIINSIYRRTINGLGFLNDPDVFVLRKDNNKLNDDQKEILVKVNFLCGGLLLTSDYTNEYDEKTNKLYQEAIELMKAKVISCNRDKKNIYLKYELNGKVFDFNFNYKKGKILNE